MKNKECLRIRIDLNGRNKGKEENYKMKRKKIKKKIEREEIKEMRRIK